MASRFSSASAADLVVSVGGGREVRSPSTGFELP